MPVFLIVVMYYMIAPFRKYFCYFEKQKFATNNGTRKDMS